MDTISFPSGALIASNLPSGASVVYSSSSIDANKKYSSDSQTLRASVSGKYAGEFTYDFSSGNLDLSSAVVDVDSVSGKSVIHNLPGSVTSKNLFIPKVSGATGAYLCPGATSISEVSDSCSSKETTGYTSVSIGGTDYWKFTGVTGSGGGNEGGGSVPEFSDYAMLTILVLVGAAIFGTSKKYI